MLRAGLSLLLAAGAHGAGAGHWLRTYPVPEFGAHWHLDISVRKFGKAREKALDLLKKYGGEPRIPVENMARSERLKYQQLSFSIPEHKSEQLFKRLKKLGRVRRSEQKPSEVVDYSVEIDRKLERLRAEREAGGELLRRLASVSEILEEVIVGLERSSAGYRGARERILLNIVIEEEGR